MCAMSCQVAPIETVYKEQRPKSKADGKRKNNKRIEMINLSLNDIMKEIK